MRRSLNVSTFVAVACALAPASAGAATIEVTTTADERELDADNGRCALREAVEASNANAPVDSCAAGSVAPDVIRLRARTYAISIPPNMSGNDNQDGDLDVEAGNGGVRVQGKGKAATAVSGASLDRVFHLESGPGGLALRRLAVRRGETAGDGGAIFAAVDTSLDLRRAVVTKSAARQGGGVYVDFPVALTIAGSRIARNEAAGDPNATDLGGGGIYTQSDLVLTDSVVERNHVTSPDSSAVGGGIHADSGDLTLSGCAVRRNVAGSANGGGIAITGGDSSSISDCDVALNRTSLAFGGGIYLEAGAAVETLDVTGSRVLGNRSRSGGAGIFTGLSDELNLLSSKVSGNTVVSGAPQVMAGGGILTQGEVFVAGSTISGNSVALDDPNGLVDGGGLYNDSGGGAVVNIVDSTISGNSISGGSTQRGAGLHLEIGAGGLFAADTVTISSNNAGSEGGGAWTAGDAEFNGVTFKGNAADAGDAIFMAGLQTILNKSVVENGGGACDGMIASGGENTDRGSSCVDGSVTGDVPNASPQLGPLRDNGGPTRTHALEPGGAAVDLVQLPCGGTDQRFFTRPFGPGCDAGSYELTLCRGRAADLVGTAAADALKGRSATDVIHALDDDDTVRARGSGDVACGGDGGDRIAGQRGGDTLVGGAGDDTLIGGAGNDRCIGGPGQDDLVGCE